MKGPYAITVFLALKVALADVFLGNRTLESKGCTFDHDIALKTVLYVSDCNNDTFTMGSIGDYAELHVPQRFGIKTLRVVGLYSGAKIFAPGVTLLQVLNDFDPSGGCIEVAENAEVQKVSFELSPIDEAKTQVIRGGDGECPKNEDFEWDAAYTGDLGSYTKLYHYYGFCSSHSGATLKDSRTVTISGCSSYEIGKVTGAASLIFVGDTLNTFKFGQVVDSGKVNACQTKGLKIVGDKLDSSGTIVAGADSTYEISSIQKFASNLAVDVEDLNQCNAYANSPGSIPRTTSVSSSSPSYWYASSIVRSLAVSGMIMALELIAF